MGGGIFSLGPVFLVCKIKKVDGKRETSFESLSEREEEVSFWRCIGHSHLVRIRIMRMFTLGVTQGYEYTAYYLALLFFVLLLGIVLTRELALRLKGSSLFFKKAPQPHKHGYIGFSYLMLLLLGFWHSSSLVMDSKLLPEKHMIIGSVIPLAVYDILLGVMGIVLTLTASRDFPHKTIKNVASGTLDEHATVTYSEMIEHAFYQGMNLAQITFLH